MPEGSPPPWLNNMQEEPVDKTIHWGDLEEEDEEEEMEEEEFEAALPPEWRYLMLLLTFVSSRRRNLKGSFIKYEEAREEENFSDMVAENQKKRKRKMQEKEGKSKKF
ncbi:uncharacterized protein LOC133294774 [Gastrolobium bilobum]|uniref:uncharacterized protein LOC133294774 n=1 Tax=Gastrolobium bilobum TaxID=150636 RepID=UPI002AB1759B|nr:uncharacterized protein LOC133294774 [Gastrolobium bilobum]XP_061349510.1 uncharacterized protein LOC133294774 [Gastrolobium bilobum]